MIRWLKAFFAWRFTHECGVWIYSENAITGRRAAHRANSGGHSPLDWEWLLSGEGMPKIDGIPAWRSGYRDSLPDGWFWS
jgi:hypothetical protein